MVEIVRRARKSPVLTPSRIPCLRHLPTINVTEGCTLGCRYCYIQDYAGFAGPHRVTLFENTAELVERELSRKRQRPRRVYFSPSSDAFQDRAEIRDVTYRTMAVLLAAGVEVAFLTKGFVTERFLRLFAKTPRLVFAQLGVTTLDRNLWRTFEPRTAAPADRIATIRARQQSGIHTTARLDPLIPDLTDEEGNLTPLLGAIREAGVRRMSASYLFLRPGFAVAMRALLRRAGVECAGWRWNRFSDGCGGGTTLAAAERAGRLRRVRDWGRRAGIGVVVCRCKNPELGGPGCEIAGPAFGDRRSGDNQGTFAFAADEVAQVADAVENRSGGRLGRDPFPKIVQPKRFGQHAIHPVRLAVPPLDLLPPPGHQDDPRG